VAGWRGGRGVTAGVVWGVCGGGGVWGGVRDSKSGTTHYILNSGFRAPAPASGFRFYGGVDQAARVQGRFPQSNPSNTKISGLNQLPARFRPTQQALKMGR